MLISQPFDAEPSQSAQPAMQVMTAHIPSTHRDIAFGTVQEMPQEPQFRVSFVTLTSHPFDRRLPSQSANPVSQLPMQTPPPQAGVGTWVLGHEPPQVPQCLGSVAVFTSQPLVGSPSQSAYGALQEVMVHWPPGQATEALGSAHDRPHAPQFWVVSSAVSHPSSFPRSSRLQSPKPGLHSIAQVPASQIGTPFAPESSVLQTFLAQPQCCGSDVRFRGVSSMTTVTFASPLQTWCGKTVSAQPTMNTVARSERPVPMFLLQRLAEGASPARRRSTALGERRWPR